MHWVPVASMRASTESPHGPPEIWRAAARITPEREQGRRRGAQNGEERERKGEERERTARILKMAAHDLRQPAYMWVTLVPDKDKPPMMHGCTKPTREHLALMRCRSRAIVRSWVGRPFSPISAYALLRFWVYFLSDLSSGILFVALNRTGTPHHRFHLISFSCLAIQLTSKLFLMLFNKPCKRNILRIDRNMFGTASINIIGLTLSFKQATSSTKFTFALFGSFSVCHWA